MPKWRRPPKFRCQGPSFNVQRVTDGVHPRRSDWRPGLLRRLDARHRTAEECGRRHHDEGERRPRPAARRRLTVVRGKRITPWPAHGNRVRSAHGTPWRGNAQPTRDGLGSRHRSTFLRRIRRRRSNGESQPDWTQRIAELLPAFGSAALAVPVGAARHRARSGDFRRRNHSGDHSARRLRLRRGGALWARADLRHRAAHGGRTSDIGHRRCHRPARRRAR